MLLQLNEQALAISGNGATVTQWQMGPDHLFYPQQNTYNEAGRLVRRGGMYLCAPVFGHPTKAAEAGLPMHGLLRTSAPHASKLDERTGVWDFPPTGPLPGYPFSMSAEVRIELEEDGFTHRTRLARLHHRGTDPIVSMPFNFATHPYFQGPGEFEIDGRTRSFCVLPGSQLVEMSEDGVVRVRVPAGTITMRHSGYRWLNLWSDSGDYFCIEPVWDRPERWGDLRAEAIDLEDELHFSTAFSFERA